MSDPWSLKAAAFVIQVLELEADPVEMAGAMSPLKRGPAGGITAVELSSSGGATPFLIYHYRLGSAGASPFEADVATMEQAERLGTPGPRIIASASGGTEAYILATTPHVQRMLAGEPARDAPPLPDVAAAERRRHETPGNLINAIRTANGLAAEWLAALRVAAEQSGDAELTFTDEESALTLYLLDDASAGDLLRALNLALSAARGQIAPPQA